MQHLTVIVKWHPFLAASTETMKGIRSTSSCKLVEPKFCKKQSMHELLVVRTRWSLNAGIVNGRFYCSLLVQAGRAAYIVLITKANNTQVATFMQHEKVGYRGCHCICNKWRQIFFRKLLRFCLFLNQMDLDPLLRKESHSNQTLNLWDRPLCISLIMIILELFDFHQFSLSGSCWAQSLNSSHSIQTRRRVQRLGCLVQLRDRSECEKTLNYSVQT